ncbi:MAG TPA: hypothetical protein V6D33_08910 [Cyanophyceae cyanobacterium]
MTTKQELVSAIAAVLKAQKSELELIKQQVLAQNKVGQVQARSRFMRGGS